MSDIIPSDELIIDDCWNRIGVHGDHSCERLVRHVHCRNCEVYEHSAAIILDRLSIDAAPSLLQDASGGDALSNSANIGAVSTSALMDAIDGTSDRTAAALAPSNPAVSRAEGEPMLVFRVADEWFALSARFVAQVAEASAIHSLPKLRSKAVLGLANVRGQLTVCVSLMRLLDLTERQADRTAGSAGGGARREGAGVAKERTAVRRFVVTRDVSSERARERRGDDATVFPVDEIFGIERFSRDAHRAVPATLTHAAAFHTRSIVDWRGRSVGVLDSALLFETLRRSLG